MELHRSDVNVVSFIDSVVSIFHTPARGKDITIQMELDDPSMPTSQGVSYTDLFSIDKFKMSQVLRNLLSNALKFTPEGGTITIRACFIPDDGTSTERTTHTSNKPLLKPVNTTASLWSLLRLRRKPQSQIHQSEHSTGVTKAVNIDVEGGNDQGRTARQSANVQQSAQTPTQQGVLRISVTDTGAGISVENQKRLFNEIIQFNPEILQGGGGSGFGNYDPTDLNLSSLLTTNY